MEPSTEASQITAPVVVSAIGVVAGLETVPGVAPLADPGRHVII